MIRMEADSSHIHRRVDSTPPQWKTRGWKVEFIRRKSSDKFDILITTPPPRCQKIRSVRALARFISEHGVSLRVEDLGSLKPGAGLEASPAHGSPQHAAGGQGCVSVSSTATVACLDGPGQPSLGTAPDSVQSEGPPAGCVEDAGDFTPAEEQTGGACIAGLASSRVGGDLEGVPVRPLCRSASPSIAASTCTDDGLPSSPRRRRGTRTSPYFRRAVGTDGPRKGRWLPPRSPFALVQEELYHDPFQLLVATILLNKTRGEAAVPVIWRLLARWPTAATLLEASEEDLAAVIRPLGLHRRRAHNIRRFAEEFLRERWTYPDELYGISKYGCDSYRIFCVDEWRDVRPTDHMLLKYVAWLEQTSVRLMPDP